MANPPSLLSALSLLLIIITSTVFAKVVYEEGYVVSTVVDGNKLKINPHSVLFRSGSSDIILLDSADSSFYTLSLAQDRAFPTDYASTRHGSTAESVWGD